MGCKSYININSRNGSIINTQWKFLPWTTGLTVQLNSIVMPSMGWACEVNCSGYCTVMHSVKNTRITPTVNSYWLKLETSWWWLFPCLRGFGENIGPLIPHLRFLFFLFLKWRWACAHYSTLRARISPQWLSKLRRLWLIVPWQV